MPEWLINTLATMGPVAILASGGLMVKVSRLQADVAQCVTREILSLYMENIRTELRLISAGMNHNTNPNNTNPGVPRVGT